MRPSPHPNYERPSGWNALLPAREPQPALTGDHTADLVVIGGGFTGLAAAQRWAELRPDTRVVILESSDVGEGNPGRNSGFLLEISLANDANAAAVTRLNTCNELIGATMNRLRDAVFDAGINCGIERAGTFRAAAGANGRAALDNYARFLEVTGLPFERLKASDLEDRLGTAFYSSGLYSPHCYLVQPAALIRGLATTLPTNVSLFERSPALAIRRSGRCWSISGKDATVTADKVIVANNAFAKHLGLGASRLVKMFTYAALTDPLPDDTDSLLGSVPSWGLLPAHRLGCTLRRTRDRRLLIRSHYGYEREASNAAVEATLLASLKARFPALPVSGFASVWGGATGFTLNGAPLWGEAKPGLYVSAGCNGGGVVKGQLFGRLLAEKALGQVVPDIHALFGRASWMPPEPLRSLGFRIASRWERRRGRAEM